MTSETEQSQRTERAGKMCRNRWTESVHHLNSNSTLVRKYNLQWYDSCCKCFSIKIKLFFNTYLINMYNIHVLSLWVGVDSLSDGWEEAHYLCYKLNRECHIVDLFWYKTIGNTRAQTTDLYIIWSEIKGEVFTASDQLQHSRIFYKGKSHPSDK